MTQQAIESAGAEIPIDPGAFRDAMKRFASGVTIVTTVDQHGESKGFTASAFCSLSVEPPLVLVCQARTASSYETFAGCDRFLVNILSEKQEKLALRFARSGGDKFAGGEFRPSRRWQLPLLADALAVVRCEMYARYDGGDHDIYVGKVKSCRARDGAPMLHFDSRFWALADRGEL